MYVSAWHGACRPDRSGPWTHSGLGDYGTCTVDPLSLGTKALYGNANCMFFLFSEEVEL
eukprot:COSAG02_NODE_412_length_22836_cov_41.209966_1_plen_59_part_00